MDDSGRDEGDIQELQDLYTYRRDQKYLQEYLRWDDSKFMVTLTDHRFDGKECHDLLVRLENRNLLKRIYQRQIKELPETCRVALLEISKPENKALRSKLEHFLWDDICKLVADKCNGEITCAPDNPNFLIVHAYTVKSVREMSRNDEGSIPVKNEIRAPSTFEEESTLFNSINEKLNQAFVEIYAPVKYDTPVDRNKLKTIINKVVTEKIDGFFKGGENATT